MKKIICTFLALAMICSLMVVNVSAANTYEGEMFEIVTDYEFEFDGGLDVFEGDEEYEGYEHYLYFCWFEDLGSEIEIWIDDAIEIFESDGASSCEEYYEMAKKYRGDDWEEILIDGIPAFVDYDTECSFCSIKFWSDNYYYDIEIEAADAESLELLYDLFVEGFRITDSTSWYESDDADDNNDKADKDNKDDKATDEEKESNSDNTTIIIVAIVVGGVVILGVTAIVVLGKKKKQ